MSVVSDRAILLVLLLLGFICNNGLAFISSQRQHRSVVSILLHQPLHSLPRLRKFQTQLHYTGTNYPPSSGEGDPSLRFDRTAASIPSIEEPCILTIEGKQYNMTAWAKAHPGGSSILKRFHNQDATKAFYASGHSQRAIDMLKDFLVEDGDMEQDMYATNLNLSKTISTNSRLSRIRTKLFTKEDPIGIHKYAGLFCIFHFAVRYLQTWFGDVSAGFGTRQGLGSSALPLLCLIPHTLLSLSSLIFHTVPRERIVGRPMIWQEFRAHNILFGMRSIVGTGAAWTAIRFPQTRRIATAFSCGYMLLTMYLADVATEKLRDNSLESTTATMPYWEGCTIETQRNIKTFYAFSQFMATMACSKTWNPAWPLVCLFPIQIASLLMTLVRKGLLSTKGYHMAYGLSLCLPYLTVLRSTIAAGSWEAPLLSGLAFLMFNLRRRGVNKYALWGSYALMRVSVFDSLLDWRPWTV